MSEGIAADMDFTLTSLDDFTHLSVDRFMSSSFSKSQYNQVIFHGLEEIYPTDSDINCTYSLAENVTPQAGDKIAIFKVGWVSVSDYICFIRIQVPDNAETTTYEVSFKAGSFPRNENELYQLCYVTNGNVIAGASIPFSFRKPHESEFVAVEDPSDAGLVVFRSRVTQLQDDLEKTKQDKELIASRYALLEDKFNILKKEFELCESNFTTSKELLNQSTLKQNELDSEKEKLQKELHEIKTDLNHVQSIYDILNKKHEEQLKKSEELEKKIEEISNEKRHSDESILQHQETISRLNETIKTYENNFAKCTNEISLLSERISAFEKENENLKEKLGEEQKSLEELSKNDTHVPQEVYQEAVGEVQKLKMMIESLSGEKEQLRTELQECSYLNENLKLDATQVKFKLEELAIKQNRTMTETCTLREQLEQAQHLIECLKKETGEQRILLSSGELPNKEFLECKEERDLFRAQFENLQLHHAKCKQKLIDQTNELNLMFDMDKRKMAEENKKLKERIVQLERNPSQPSSSKGAGKTSHTKDPTNQLFEVLSDAYSHVFENKSPKSKQTEKESSEQKTVDMEKQELREKLKMTLNKKAELSEHLVQEKHKNSELEQVLLEKQEVNASLKSRINVLEYELATMKNASVGSNNVTTANTSPSPQSVISEQLDSLNKSLPAIMKFNEIVAEQKILQEKYQDEKNAKIMLQSKVEFLLQEDAKMSNKVQQLTETCDKLLKEKGELLGSLNAENVEMLQTILEDNDCTISSLKGQLYATSQEREKLDNIVKELRKELVGKISAENLAEYKNKIVQLEKKLERKEQEFRYMARFIQDRFRNTGQGGAIVCPMCTLEFPSPNREEFVRHFDNHLF